MEHLFQLPIMESTTGQYHGSSEIAGRYDILNDILIFSGVQTTFSVGYRTCRWIRRSPLLSGLSTCQSCWRTVTHISTQPWTIKNRATRSCGSSCVRLATFPIGRKQTARWFINVQSTCEGGDINDHCLLKWMVFIRCLLYGHNPPTTSTGYDTEQCIKVLLE